MTFGREFSLYVSILLVVIKSVQAQDFGSTSNKPRCVEHKDGTDAWLMDPRNSNKLHPLRIPHLKATSVEGWVFSGESSKFSWDGVRRDTFTTEVPCVPKASRHRKISSILCLVGGFNPSEKYYSIGMIIPQYMGKKNVPNHQPDVHVMFFWRCKLPDIP